MTGYILRRVGQMIPTLLFATAVIFGLMQLAPGDATSVLLGTDHTPEAERALREKLGLDQPLPIQYFKWLGSVVTGDLGASIRTKEPVAKAIADRVVVTATLAGLALLLALLVAIPVGVVSAVNRNSIVDYSSMGAAILGLSVPNFVLAILLILLLAAQLHLLPSSGYVSLWSDPLKAWPFYVMPVTALAVSRMALLARMLRASMLDALSKDYIRTARAKGLHRRTVLARHALRNSLIPLITVVAINFVHLLGGSVVIELIFGIPGLGSLLVASVLFRDVPVVQGVTLMVAVFFMFSSIAADVLYAVTDPRIRYQ